MQSYCPFIEFLLCSKVSLRDIIYTSAKLFL
nr:MAG TPA: hypothetical protein [Caudoviricetes sp.]